MSSSEPYSVLLVEDSQTQRFSMRVLLQQAGYQVEVAENGRAAIEKIRQQEPTLVVTDLEMPELDGLELVQLANREFPALPVILVTGQGSEDVAVKALQSGAASYVSKEESVGTLLDTVERVIVASRPGHGFGYLLNSLDQCSYSFVLTNDRALVYSLVQYLQQLVERICFRDATELRNVGTAVEEALLNALYHGNLELPEEVSKLDDEARNEFICKRRQESPYQQRKIYITIEVSPRDVEVIVRDEGVGFRYQERFRELLQQNNSGTAITEGLRGLLLIHMFMDSVEFNKHGNEIRMLKRKPGTSSQPMETVELAP